MNLAELQAYIEADFAKVIPPRDELETEAFGSFPIPFAAPSKPENKEVLLYRREVTSCVVSSFQTMSGPAFSQAIALDYAELDYRNWREITDTSGLVLVWREVPRLDENMEFERKLTRYFVWVRFFACRQPNE